MIGILDSGSGGLNALSELKSILPDVDTVFLQDRKNAPYGTKSENELVSICNENILRLKKLGAEKVLIACCTASTVYEKLSPEIRCISIPIILPTALFAKHCSKNRKIAVMATERTVNSHAFKRALPEFCVKEFAAQELVDTIDKGEYDGNISEKTEKYLKSILTEENICNADTLILGCTHFPSLKEEIKKIVLPLSVNNIVSSSTEGVKELLKVCDLKNCRGHNKNFIIYT